jgi:hypothetical protein
VGMSADTLNVRKENGLSNFPVTPEKTATR